MRAGSPATLLIQGEPDVIQPAPAARVLYWKLVECGVPAVNIVYPLTNHAFDLLLPQTSPPAHAALYYLDRFADVDAHAYPMTFAQSSSLMGTAAGPL